MAPMETVEPETPERLTEILRFRVTASELREIEAGCKAAGATISEHLRERVILAPRREATDRSPPARV
jgi:Mobilization protein NikA